MQFLGLWGADPLEPECRDYEDLYQDLAKIRIVAVVFTGRGSRMKALLPYLRRDLKVHKGVLDGIVFALIRPDPPAMELVQRMVMEYGEQIQVQDYTGTWKNRMADLYTSFNDTRAVYIKACFFVGSKNLEDVSLAELSRIEMVWS